VGRNAHQDINSTNNNLNNNSRSSPERRRITATTVEAAAVVAIPPPTPLPPRVRDPPTSTPGPTLFKCGRVPGRSASSNLTCVRRLRWLAPFPVVLHRRSGRPSHHHSRLCPSTVVSSRLQRLRLRRHGPHGQTRGINSYWPTPLTSWSWSLLRSPIGWLTPTPPITPLLMPITCPLSALLILMILYLLLWRTNPLFRLPK
jgi:hypothetical protein